MFAKQVMPCDTNFAEFKPLYAIGGHEINPSDIYYMELVDKHPDSAETMRYVAELLLHSYDIYI